MQSGRITMDSYAVLLLSDQGNIGTCNYKTFIIISRLDIYNLSLCIVCRYRINRSLYSTVGRQTVNCSSIFSAIGSVNYHIIVGQINNVKCLPCSHSFGVCKNQCNFISSLLQTAVETECPIWRHVLLFSFCAVYIHAKHA